MNFVFRKISFLVWNLFYFLVYHTKCIDPWLTKNRRVCPICKRKVFAHDEPQHDSDSDSDADDTTPLINSNNRGGTEGGTFQPQFENPFRRAVRSISQQSGAVNFVTASDHHSINGDYQSCNSSTTTTGSDESERVCDNLDEVHVHTQLEENHSQEGSGDVHV